ncbi:MAG: glycosyltransferase family 2 protein [bacterium]|nr:glycosyltransferase family 2 protein [bacterium]
MKKTLIPEISVFFPAYNEEGNIAKTVEKAVAVLEKIAGKYEIIIVNDGSRDRTGEIGKNLAKKNPSIKIITHKTNKGYGEALKTGFYNSRYAWICCVDADGQFDFSEITKLWEKAKNASVIIGYRLDRKDSLIRKINGFGWTLLANILLGIGVRDVDCSFKLVKKEVIEKIPKLESTRGGMISPELLGKAKKSRFKIAEVGVGHFPRTAGRQTGANLRVIFRSFIDLFRLWWKIR